jgi:hypothetical protein
MSKRATGTFQGTAWEETTFSEVEGGAKLARASVTNVYAGDLEGEGTLEYLLIYRDDGSCGFVGVERIVGRLDSRTGSFVLQHDGVYEAGTARGTWSVAPGSGTGELRDLKGEGGYVAEHGSPKATLTLEYEVG